MLELPIPAIYNLNLATELLNMPPHRLCPLPEAGKLLIENPKKKTNKQRKKKQKS